MRYSQEAAKAIVSPLSRAISLAAVATEQARLGDVGAARQAFDAALKASKSIRSLEGRLSTLRYISGRQDAAGFREDAKKTLSIAAKQALQENIDDQGKTSGTRIYILRPLAREQVKLGDNKGAITMLNKIARVAEKFEDPNRQGIEIMLTASDLARAGDLEAARKMFSCASEISQKLKHVDQRISALLSIAGEQIHSGLKMAAAETLSMAFAASDNLYDQESKNEIQASITLHYLMLQDE